MATHYREKWWYPNTVGTPAANQRAIVFGPGDTNTLATIYSDSGLTTPLANPTVTDAAGFLDFYVPDNSGQYWIFVGQQGTGDSQEWTAGGSIDNPVLSVNGLGPDGGGNVQLDAEDVGAIPEALIDAKGDLIVGSAADTAIRLPVGANGRVLAANSGQPGGVEWIPAPGGAVDSVNGQTGVVTLDATDVGADPAGAAAAAQAAAIAASQSLSTIDAAGDLYLGTGNNATTRLPIGSVGEVLTVVGGTASWEPATGGDVDSVNGQTGVVVLDAGDVGAVPEVTTENIVYGTTTAGAPLNREISTIASPDTVAWRTSEEQLRATTVADGDPAADPDDLTNRAYVAGELADYQPITTIDAAGDLYVGTGDNATTRLPAGSNDEVLTIVAGVPSWEPAQGGAVDSVNGQTGVVVLVAADVGAVPTARTITTQNGLTGGGDLSANRTIEPVYGTGANTVAQGNDTRIVNAIQQTILDAKGDIIAASANDTPVRVAVGGNGTVLTADSGQTGGVAWSAIPAKTVTETIEFVDDRPVLTTGNGQARWYNRQGSWTITGVWVSAGVVPTGADIIVDVNLNGSTIYSTQANRPTVPATTNGGALSATPNTTAVAAGDYFTVDIDQIGSTIPGGRITVGIVMTQSV